MDCGLHAGEVALAERVPREDVAADALDVFGAGTAAGVRTASRRRRSRRGVLLSAVAVGHAHDDRVFWREFALIKRRSYVFGRTRLAR